MPPKSSSSGAKLTSSSKTPVKSARNRGYITKTPISSKPKPKPNASILNYFKKAADETLFIGDGEVVRIEDLEGDVEVSRFHPRVVACRAPHRQRSRGEVHFWMIRTMRMTRRPRRRKEDKENLDNNDLQGEELREKRKLSDMQHKSRRRNKRSGHRSRQRLS